ncbi:hypothetical protein LUZ60_013274 [Juncus effusus]|nr:hypothetical protein LUZ60_013274 [Juncus effusus]
MEGAGYRGSAFTKFHSLMAALNSEEQTLVHKIFSLHDFISSLPSLDPSPQVDSLFTELVLTCIPPSTIDVSNLSRKDQEKRKSLIDLCSKAEGLLENHYSDILCTHENPLSHLSIFPYYNNYIQLSQLEFDLLSQHVHVAPTRVAFVGSGPLPLSLLILSARHMTSARFHGYDLDPLATERASKLVKDDDEVAGRIEFRTADVMSLTNVLSSYDVVFLAALVGIEREEKGRVLDHLHKYMGAGSMLVVRSAHGARGFLYPVVMPEDLKGFEVLSVYHPTDEVINSVIVARKPPQVSGHVHLQGHVQGGTHMPLTCKYCETMVMNGQLGCKMDEVAAALEELQS